MRAFPTPKRWLVPFSALLLAGSAAMVSADSPEPELSVQAATAEITNPQATLHTDEQGDLHLRVNQSLIQSSPEKLQSALLELIHNNHNYSQRPTEVDPDGNVRYLVQLGADEAGTELHIKQISVNDDVEDIASLLATNFGTLITLKAVDFLQSYATGTPLAFGSVAGDNILKDYIRNHARQAILISSLNNGEAVSRTTSAMLDAYTPDQDTGRTQWQDALPPLASAAVSAGVSYGLHDASTAWYQKSSFEDNLGVYHMSSTTNSLGLALRKVNEAAIGSYTELDQKTTRHIARAASIIETAAVLALANYTVGANPSANNGHDWGKSLFTNATSITLTYSVRDLISEVAEELTGSNTLSELVAATGMTAASSLIHVVGNPLQISSMNYTSTVGYLSAEAAGASVGFGLQKLINDSLAGQDPYKIRTARLGSAAVLSFVLKGAARQFAGHGWDAVANILSPMADGVIITNTFDGLTALKDTIVEPWLINPLLHKVASNRMENRPAIRLKAQTIRQPISA